MAVAIATGFILRLGSSAASSTFRRMGRGKRVTDQEIANWRKAAAKLMHLNQTVDGRRWRREGHPNQICGGTAETWKGTQLEVWYPVHAS
jgi:hypothetical protein